MVWSTSLGQFGGAPPPNAQSAGNVSKPLSPHAKRFEMRFEPPPTALVVIRWISAAGEGVTRDLFLSPKRSAAFS